MGRAKVKLTYISNDVVRRSTLKNRRRGLMNKLNELTTLCGVEACAIVYETKPNDSQPEVWPSHMGVQRVLSRFCNLSRTNQTKQMSDQQSYLKERVKKAKEQLMKTRRANREKEITLCIHEFVQTGKLADNLNLVDLNDLAYVTDQKMQEINWRMELLKKENEQKMKMMTNGFDSSSSSSPVLSLEEKNECVCGRC